MKTTCVLLALGLLLVLALSACAPWIPPTIVPTAPTPDMFIVTSLPLPLPGAILPVCTPAELTRVSGETMDAIVVDTGYAGYPVIDGLTPTLHWTYDDSTCTPSGFVVSIFTYSPDSSIVLTVTRVVGPADRAYSVTIADGLQPATYYRWFITPFSGTSSSVDPKSTSGFPNAFFTGPLCTAGSVKAPILTYPDDKAVVTSVMVTLGWKYPDKCLPYMYEINQATDAAFTTNLWQSTQAYMNLDESYLEEGSYLKDCTRYYWKIGASDDGLTFVYSETRSFYFNKDGACAPEAPPVLMSITVVPTVIPTSEPTPTIYNCAKHLDAGSCNNDANYCLWVPVSVNDPNGPGTCANH